MKHSDYVELIKKHLKERLVKEAYDFILGKFLFMTWGPLAPLLKRGLEYVVGHLVEKGELAAFVQYVDFRTDEQGDEYSKLIIRHQQILKDGNDGEIEESEKLVKQAFYNLVKFTS